MLGKCFSASQNEDGTKVEYRVWNPFRSKLAAAILGGVDNIWIVSNISSVICIFFYFLLHRRKIYVAAMTTCVFFLTHSRNLALRFSTLERLLVLQSHMCLTLLAL